MLVLCLHAKRTIRAPHSAAESETVIVREIATEIDRPNGSNSNLHRTRSIHPTCSARRRHSGRSVPRAGEWRVRHHARAVRLREGPHTGPRLAAVVPAVATATSARRPILRAATRAATATAEGSVRQNLVTVAHRRALLWRLTMRPMFCALGQYFICTLCARAHGLISEPMQPVGSVPFRHCCVVSSFFLLCFFFVFRLSFLSPCPQQCSHHCSVCDECAHGRGAHHRGRSGRARIAAQRPAQTEGNGQTTQMTGNFDACYLAQ